MIILGILIINFTDIMWLAIYGLSLVLLIPMMLLNLVRAILEKDIVKLLRAIGAGAIAFFLSLNRIYIISVIAIIFGFWALFNAGVHALEIYLKFKDHELGKLKKLIASLFDATIGFLLLFQGHENRLIINIQMGGYIIVYGVIQIMKSAKALGGSHLQLSLSAPVLYSALLPPLVVSGLKKSQGNTQLDQPQLSFTKGNNISIYIHMKDYGLNRLGHIDLAYNGCIYSYGNYDEDTRSRNSIYGEGVLICGPEVDFINFSVNHRTIVYQYKIGLEPQEAVEIEKRIDDLLSESYYFKNPGKKSAHLTNLEEQSPYYSFYKFRDQPYKTYNMFTTNCVMLANAILESSGLKLFQLSGIITPGTYYSYLEELLVSQVVPVERIIHTYHES